MRSESKILNLIKSFAAENEKVRGLILNGSRVNPNVKKDIFQDYDIIYLANDVDYFKQQNIIFEHFGQPVLMQKPEDKILPPPMNDGRYIYLMQFEDGSRIDMTFADENHLDIILEDSLSKVLIDKDNILNRFKKPSEKSYFTKKPSEKEFDDTCNEFIWGIGSHIPKTIWRKELPLLKTLINLVLRKPLLRMIDWEIAIRNDFKVSTGKGYKKLKEYLEPEIWEKYKKTYSDYKYESIWNSLFILHELFEKHAREVADKLDFDFPEKESEKAMKFLKHVKNLPVNAKSIY